MAALDERGETARADKAGVERVAIIELAARLKPDETLDFDQAITELSAAVDVAVDVAKQAERGTNLGAFVDRVLERIAEKTKLGDFNGAAKEADEGYAQWEREEDERRTASIRSGIALLEAGIAQDKLRRDPVSAALRVEKIVDLQHGEADERFAALCAKQHEFYVEGRDKGVTLDLLISIEVARLASSRARSVDQRGSSLNDLAVKAQQVVLGQTEPADGRLTCEASMGPVPVIAMKPGGQRVVSLV
jgi:hypothetical protein